MPTARLRVYVGRSLRVSAVDGLPLIRTCVSAPTFAAPMVVAALTQSAVRSDAVRRAQHIRIARRGATSVNLCTRHVGCNSAVRGGELPADARARDGALAHVCGYSRRPPVAWRHRQVQQRGARHVTERAAWACQHAAAHEGSRLRTLSITRPAVMLVVHVAVGVVGRRTAVAVIARGALCSVRVRYRGRGTDHDAEINAVCVRTARIASAGAPGLVTIAGARCHAVVIADVIGTTASNATVVATGVQVEVDS